MRIALGSDHAGFELKKHLAAYLEESGHEVEDFGSFSAESVDYSDYGFKVAAAVGERKFDRGVLACRSGIGMSIAANKVRGVMAALCRDTESAKLSRRHNDSNVLVLAAGFTSEEEARHIVDIWLVTPFEGGRHSRRVGKISQFEEDRAERPRDVAVRPGASGGSEPWSFQPRAVREVDAELFRLMQLEKKRLAESLVLVASESIVETAILEATGNIFSPKYAEGYPGERLYPGCEVVDAVELLAIERAKQVFGADHVNVQPYSGTQANMAAYFALLRPGDKILSMRVEHGGHTTHGCDSNFSGRLYKPLRYGLKRDTELIDYDAIADIAEKEKPRLIIAGGSAYSRLIDFARFKAIADSCGSLLMVDMAHLSGLIAAGIHPSPVPFCDVATSTTHKTLKGPRGGLILCRRELADAIDEAVFPGTQGGPLVHVISAKALCFKLALRSEFREFHVQVVSNCKALAAELQRLGYRIVSGGTDTHLLVVDVRQKGIDGADAWQWLEEAGILVNKCAVPFDEAGPFGGIRVGPLSLTSRGMKEAEMATVAEFIHRVLRTGPDVSGLSRIRSAVREFCSGFGGY
ncbi:MAG: ribose 5-phosphate isomerase B [Candidatus Eiseniibacteriota bacterium]|nr:MAG: ribose 5-phosphate isomerase B [Candidatus Eisenbacteria bacterium]